MIRITKQVWIFIVLTAVIFFAVYFFVISLPVIHRDPIPRTIVAFGNADSAISIYLEEYRAFPQSFEELLSSGNDRNIAFLEDLKCLADAWDQLIRFSLQTDGYELRSAGPDKAFGTEDDIIKKKIIIIN